MDCLKNKREAERDYRDPEKREKMYPGETVFTMTCDKVNAKVRIKEDGSWEILDILGRHEEAYREKKSWELHSFSTYVDNKNNDDWERISAWTLRVVMALMFVMAYLIITGKIDQWLG